MSLPINLVLVRHGQSEGNLAKRRSEAGDHTAFEQGFSARHTSSFRLTKLGQKQAMKAGDWLRNEFASDAELMRPGSQHVFDRYYVSEYLRAMETAGLINLPKAEWLCDFYLTERDWGELDNRPENEREEKFGEALRRREVEPFFWSPPNGESFAQLCLRVDRVLNTLHRECGDKRVVIVCHGEVMWAFRARIERMSQSRFKELHLSTDPANRIHNCQIIHYSRRSPTSGKLTPYVEWMRMIRPTENPPQILMNWTQIVRPRYSNEELLETVRKTPAMIVS